MYQLAHKTASRVLPVLLALGAPALHAQTIVPNPHLNTNLPPWGANTSLAPDPVGSGAAPVWQSPPDVDNSPASGSSLIGLTPSATNATAGMAQCFDFAAPTSVAFLNYGMAFFVPAALALDGSMSANVEIRLFSGAGCSGFLSGATQGQTLTAAAVPPATWFRIADTSFVPAGAPVMAASAQVRGYLRQTAATPTQASYALNLDHFVVVLNSTTPVELLRFDIE